ncbi:MAG: DUF456 domain-containing protein [Treponema sp.]|nr:DUF456 domain-containing protein [Treponema sp.]
MNLSILLTILAVILLIVGFLGTFVPVIPGAPLAWVGILLAYFSSYNDISLVCLIITGVVAVAVSVLDNFLPVLMTDKVGGSKAATVGSTIGLIAGFFLGPAGIIAGPFLGALVGEMIHSGGNFSTSIKAAWGAFLGFLLGTGIKMIAVGFFIWIFVRSF